MRRRPRGDMRKRALISRPHLERMTLIRFRRVGRAYEWIGRNLLTDRTSAYEWIIGYLSTIQHVA